MSKELEALEKVRNCLYPWAYDNQKAFDIIEAALKDYERLKTSYLENLNNEESKEYIYKKLKALEIIKETPIFAWYVSIYKNAYEMVADAKGFRVNNSVEELQQMFDLLKEILL